MGAARRVVVESFRIGVGVGVSRLGSAVCVFVGVFVRVLVGVRDVVFRAVVGTGVLVRVEVRGWATPGGTKTPIPLQFEVGSQDSWLLQEARKVLSIKTSKQSSQSSRRAATHMIPDPPSCKM